MDILISWAGVSLYYRKFILWTQRNIVGSCCVLLHEAISLTGFKLCSVTLNNMQQGVQTDATCSILRCCWPPMLRPFTQGLMIHWFVLGLLETRTLESESDRQTNRPRHYKCDKVSRLISDTFDTVDTCRLRARSGDCLTLKSKWESGLEAKWIWWDDCSSTAWPYRIYSN